MKYWKVQLSAKDLGVPDGAVEQLLGTYSTAQTVQVLSRAALVIANTPYRETLETQRFLASGLFSLELRETVDAWIKKNHPEGEVYLVNEKQLLKATLIALSAPRKRREPLPADGLVLPIGHALLHLANEQDPFKNLMPALATKLPLADRRLLVEFVLRTALFHADDDHRYAIARYDEMFSSIVPVLKDDPDYIDVLAVFRRTTGLRFRTYLAMGLALLTMQHTLTRKNPTAAINVQTKRISRNLAVRRSAALFFRETATRRRAFLRARKRDVRAYGNESENFLEAERHPLIYLKRDLAACINLKFFERKLSSGVHHILLRGLKAADHRRYGYFFGRVFERYVHRVCGATFPDRFTPGFKYGKPEKEAADGWIVYPKCAVVLEAKSARFSLGLRLSGDFGLFERTFRESILRAARQLSRAIDDLRAGQFNVQGLSGADLPRLLPVVVTLDYVPLDYFLSGYVNEILQTAGVLTQPNVGGLTLVSIKDLEHLEGAIKNGATFAGLLEERLASDVWKTWPFGNFLFDRFPKGFDVNSVTAERFKGLLRHAALAVLGARLSD